MKQSSSSGVYPSNVYNGDSHNRQQIATILQSMGFETDDIAKAFNIFEKSYGDKKYDISVLTEIVFQLQSDPDNKLLLEAAQSHSAPNSPLPQNQDQHQQHQQYPQQQQYPVLQHSKLQQAQPPPPPQHSKSQQPILRYNHS